MTKSVKQVYWLSSEYVADCDLVNSVWFGDITSWAFIIYLRKKNENKACRPLSFLGMTIASPRWYVQEAQQDMEKRNGPSCYNKLCTQISKSACDGGQTRPEHTAAWYMDLFLGRWALYCSALDEQLQFLCLH